MLRLECAAARLLGLRVRIAPEVWMSVCCQCSVLSGRSLCVRLITHPEESYRLWCVILSVIVNLESKVALAHFGLLRHGGKKIKIQL